MQSLLDAKFVFTSNAMDARLSWIVLLNLTSILLLVAQGLEEEDVKYDSYSRTLKLALDLGNEAAFSWEMGLMNNNNFRLDLQKLSNGTSCVKDGPKKSLVTCPEAFRKQLVSNIRSKRVCLTDYHQDVTNGTNPWIFCDLSMTAGQDIVEVTFRHVYSGCYCFRLATYSDDNIRSARYLLRSPVQLVTEAKEPDVFKWNLTLDLAALNQQDLSLYFKLEDPVLDFDYYHVELFRLEDGQSNCLAIHDDMSAAHQVSLNVTATKEAWVTFPNQSYGAYCVVVIPEDERCHAIWPDGRGSQLNNRTCQRHSNTATLEDGAGPSLLLSLTDNPTGTLWWSVSLAIFFVVAVLAASAYLYRRFREPQKTNPSAPYQPIVQLDERPLLLLYSQKDQLIQQGVQRMKAELKREQPDLVIYDDAEDDMANVEGTDWFQQRLTGVTDLRVWIVSSPELIRCQHSLQSPPVRAEEMEDLDLVALYRLDALVSYLANVGDPYRTAFIVGFDDDVADDPNRNVLLPNFVSLVTPYRSYRWPSDRDRLTRMTRSTHFQL